MPKGKPGRLALTWFFNVGPVRVATRGRRTKDRLRWRPSTELRRSRKSANDGSVVVRSKLASFRSPRRPVLGQALQCRVAPPATTSSQPTGSHSPSWQRSASGCAFTSPGPRLASVAVSVAVFGVLADVLDRDHMLVLGGIEHDDALGRAAGDADTLDRTADQLAVVGHQHDLVEILDRE